MKKSFFIFFIIFIPTFLLSATKIITIEVDGFGSTRDEALQNALIEAVKQSDGVSINSKKVFYKNIKQQSSLVSNKININKQSNYNIQEATKGLINQYRIINTKKIASNEYRVKTIVKLLKYTADGISANNRRKIAVVRFKNLTNSKISKMLSHYLTTDLTQSRKFAVLEKTYTKDIDKELALIQSNKVASSQKIKLRQKFGADYLLVGTIQKASIDKKRQHNQLLGESSISTVVNLVVDYRVVVVATSQIKYSDTALLSMEFQNQLSNDDALRKGAKKIAKKITSNLLKSIYPIKVIKTTQDANVVLNEGGKLVHNGMILEVFKTGKILYDPYTKEPLGYEEIKVADIKIVKTTSKISYAKVIDGKLSSIKNGYICRRKIQNKQNQSQHQDNTNWRKSDIKINSRGGVKLPFD